MKLGNNGKNGHLNEIEDETNYCCLYNQTNKSSYFHVSFLSAPLVPEVKLRRSWLSKDMNSDLS